MVDSFVNLLTQRLPQLLIQEAIYLVEVKDQVISFEKQLKRINAFLEESKKKREDHELMMEVVRQIRDVAARGEDVIDLYIYYKAKHNRRNIVLKTFNFMNYWNRLHDIGKEIEDINLEIEKIYKDKEKHDNEKTEEEARMEARVVKALHNRRKNVEEEDVVGFVHDSTTLVKQLTTGKQDQLDVSSIFGMGGLGKTTLAKKVYNKVRQKNHFNCYAWVYVSQDFRCKELLIEILKSQMKILDSKRELEELSEEELKTKLAEYLREKKYLVVVDDVWTTEVWDELKAAFPNNLNGSRILITSREKKVVSHSSRGTRPYLLPFLSEDESWELLRKKVFKGKHCPTDLEELGREIAASCDGLPLSIVVLGGLLANEEKKKHVWERYIGNVNWYLRQEKSQWEAILALSYTQLPRHLKPCFLYFGLYPEDYEISVKQLIQLWIAEGFIQDTDGRNMEDVAEIYLEELIGRSLIQVASNRTGGGAKTCRIHDLLRDFCISKSKEEMFFKVCKGPEHNSTERTRRLSIFCSADEYILSNPSDGSCARSLLFFGQNSHVFNDDNWKWVLKNFKLVRVLNFGRTRFECISNDIEQLIHLRYLRIKLRDRNVIMPSICNLRNLETLDARGCTLKCLPIEIWKLQRLRNLYLSGPVSFPEPSDTDDKSLSKLQVLSTIMVDLQTASLMTEGKLPNIRKLGICYSGLNNRKLRGGFAVITPEWKPREVLRCLRRLRHLQVLKVIDCSEFPTRVKSFPLEITKITLLRVHLNGMAVLGMLSKLRILKIQDCSFNQTPYALAGWFRQLEVFKLDNFQIKNWIGAIPSLKHLIIKNNKILTIPPEESCKMTSLQDVELLCTNIQLVRMFQEMEKKIGFRLQIHHLPNDKFVRKHRHGYSMGTNTGTTRQHGGSFNEHYWRI